MDDDLGLLEPFQRREIGDFQQVGAGQHGRDRDDDAARRAGRDERRLVSRRLRDSLADRPLEGEEIDVAPRRLVHRRHDLGRHHRTAEFRQGGCGVDDWPQPKLRQRNAIRCRRSACHERYPRLAPVRAQLP